MPDISLPFEILSVAFNRIPVIGVIFVIIQILKSFAPEDTNPQLWRGLALILGIVGCLVWQFRESGPPADVFAWFDLLIVGVVFGFAAMRLYEQTLSDAERSLLKKTLRGSKHSHTVIDLTGLPPDEAKAKLEEAFKTLAIQSAKEKPAASFYTSVDNGGRTPV